MPIDAYANETQVVAKIVGNSKQDKAEALRLLHSVADSDLSYNAEKGEYIVAHPERYKCLKFIESALNARELQLRLF